MVLCFLIVLGFNLNGQIQEKSFDQPYLEHLIKVKIDSVRAHYQCPKLVNDSILFIAARHHAQYMNLGKNLTHYESESKHFKTPQDRADYYGAQHYRVGENVLSTPINTQLTNKKNRTFDLSQLDQLATSIVEGWVNSPGHFKNIITPSYNITGVSLALDFKNQELYACQKFAQVNFKYQFSENPELFPYSGYTQPPITSSFEGIPNTLSWHKHDWKIEHGAQQDCASCLQAISSKPPITLQVIRGNFVLKIENADYVKQLLINRKDGFAIEIVTFNDYVCGNPAYYEKPSRRNGQCQLNGRVLQPVYSAELIKGFKKRKRIKDFHFLSYLFTESEIPFFRRIYTSKLERYSSAYFQIKLGKIPKDIQGYWNHNLVYLQNNRVCNIDYFTGYCGASFNDSATTRLLIPQYDTSYSFQLDTNYSRHTFHYDQKAHHFPKDQLIQVIDSLKNHHFVIDSAQIVSYSSIEGDSLKNYRYRLKRAQEIQQILQTQLPHSTSIQFDVSDSWETFLEHIQTEPELTFLMGKNKTEIQKRLTQGLADSLTGTLDQQRKSTINLSASLPLNRATRAYYIQKTYDAFLDSLSQSNLSKRHINYYLTQLNQLYGYAFQKIREGQLDSTLLAKLFFPNYYLDHPGLTEKILLAGIIYPSVFHSYKYYQENRLTITNKLLRSDGSNTSPLFRYTIARAKYQRLALSKNRTHKSLQGIVRLLETIPPRSIQSQEVRSQVQHLVYNINVHLLSHIWFADPIENAENAYSALNQVLSYQLAYRRMNDSLAYALGKLAIHYGNNDQAMMILGTYGTSAKNKALLMTLGYVHVSASGSQTYYTALKNAYTSLGTEVWCELFLNDCTIPFQAFDDETLRDLFCAECLDKNTFLDERIFKNTDQ